MPDETDPLGHYWRRKLAAYLHDSPDKAADLLTHELRAKQFKALFQLDPSDFSREADWSAAAADRLPFPKPSSLVQPLSGLDRLPHPLGGASLPLAPFRSAAEAEEVSAGTMPFLLSNRDPRAAFLCAWRFWRNWASSRDPRFSHLPADTRIPDHTIWNHLAITTAFQGAISSGETPTTEPSDAGSRPRLLLFSLGPVQEFIATARSTRDLWSGSYLLSFLVSKALRRIALDLGPDHVIFPNLLDQPLIDLRLKSEVFGVHSFAERPVWEGFRYEQERQSALLTPSLPNRFLALLPAVTPDGHSSEDYAGHLAEDIRDELDDIAGSVRSFLDETGIETVGDFDAGRFGDQAKRMLEIHWQLLPLPGNLDDLDQWLTALPPDDAAAGYTPRRAFETVRKMAETSACAPQYPLRPTSNWAGLNALLSWLHDGAKATRTFDAWRQGRWDSGRAFNKDALSGKEEAALTITATKEDVADFCAKDLGMSRGTLKRGEALGAATLIKRFWWHTFLPDLLIPDGVGQADEEFEIERKRRLVRDGHPMPNTHAVARRRPFASSDENEVPEHGSEKYFAILALDGDEMGKWISGSKSPANRHCLSPIAESFYAEHAPDFLDSPRALNPSWHQQFSEALGNFAFHCVQRIVEAFDGRLLYAGGDDVLAMLPAIDALPCARALRAAFRGDPRLNELAIGRVTGSGQNRRSDRKTPIFDISEPGYLRLHPDASDFHGEKKHLVSDPVDFTALLPGPRADVSVGIAVAHFKSPLQDVVRAAQAAEKRAKRAEAEGGFGRGALAVSVFKRSGEILEWGCRWATRDERDDPTDLETAGYRLLATLVDDLAGGKLNARFPHKLEALLAPYRPQGGTGKADSAFEGRFAEILRREADHALRQNEGGTEGTGVGVEDFAAYWAELAATDRPFGNNLELLVNLLRSAAWITNTSPEDGSGDTRDDASATPAAASSPAS